MAHNTRRYPDASYVTKFVPTAVDFKAWDTTLTKSLNGDAGGTYAPAAAITIGGAGVWLAGQTTLNFPAILLNAEVVFDDGDYLQFAQTRALASPAVMGASLGARCDWSPDQTTIGVVGKTTSAAWSFPLRVHDGATLSTVAFWFQLLAHSSPPPERVRFRVLKVDKGGTATPLGSAADAQGYVAASIAAYSSTAVQSTSYATGAHVVDLATYSYVAEVVEELWVSGTTFFGAVATLATLDMRPQ